MSALRAMGHRYFPVSRRLWLTRLRHGELPAQQGIAAWARSLRSAPSSGTVLHGPWRAPLSALVVTSFDAWNVRTAHHDQVFEVLDRAEIGARSVPDVGPLGRLEPRMVEVPADRWDAAVEALRVLAARPGWWVRMGHEPGPRRPSALHPGRGALPGPLTVFRYLAAPDGTVLAGEGLGVLVCAVPAHLAGSGQHEPATEVRADALEVCEPLDVVYTWVDGDDPAWRARRDEALGRSPVGTLHPTALSQSRFTSRDELRYSLRSVEMYANWVRDVVIVTDGQVPEWLDQANPRVRVVPHREIFRATDALPTFNSHAIESQLHHVVGLSGRYLYLNDDVMIGRPVRPELFFEANGINRFFLSDRTVAPGPVTSDDLPVDAAAKRNRELLAEKFGVSLSRKMQHTPHPQSRSVLEEMEASWPDVFERVARARFRDPEDVSIASSLQHYYAYRTGRAVPGRLAYTYLDLADADLSLQLAGLLRARDRDVFCINEVHVHPDRAADVRSVVGNFLSAYFPLRSSFER